MNDQVSERVRPPLTEISNTAVALHREHFGRGPGAAKSFVADDLLVCVLSDVFTPVERTLIEAGATEEVRRLRDLHADAREGTYRARMEAVVERPVTAYLSSVSFDPDVAVDVYVLAASDGEDPVLDGAAE